MYKALLGATIIAMVLSVSACGGGSTTVQQTETQGQQLMDLKEAYDNGDVTWTIETASDLAGPWTPVTPGDDSATTISYTLPTGMGRIFARLKMTTP